MTRSRLSTATVTAACALALTALGTGGADAADPRVAPGGNFDLSVWQLQEPVGSPGKPTTIPSSRLQGPNGYQDAYFYTDTRDGAMTYGSAADWALAGSHRMSATLRVVSVTRNVCVGQIHLGSGGSSTKPLVELYYHANGDIVLGTEDSPSGGQTQHPVGHVSVGKTWSYTIAVSGGNTVELTVNGATSRYTIPSAFKPYKQYFKAGSYNQSSSDSTTDGARVAFYGLTVSHR
ncbi:polysaccharide lyase family 7 protein [Streptomyces sp. NPDC046881]|uniref:polysaccharide lyase family 7 protein n=1 Tax=Streptomyces sp. NPDC046881 TaxID=3155374 RepID=UPI0033D23B4E